MSSDLILKLYSQPNTVFTLGEVSQNFPQIPYQNLRRRIHYFIKNGKLKRLRPGIYGKENYNPLEVANKVYTPSYISLETVLEKEGIIFQKYETIFAVSYLTRKIIVSGHQIFYRKIKDNVLLNREGIEEKDGYWIASKERAFLDAVFIYKDYYFDNLGSLDWDKVRKFKKIYYSKALEKRVEEYYQIFKQDYVKH